jgi:hypothetical protein
MQLSAMSALTDEVLQSQCRIAKYSVSVNKARDSISGSGHDIPVRYPALIVLDSMTRTDQLLTIGASSMC